MAALKIRGIVVEESAMGDKDKRLVILTRELGRLSVLAKGAKSTTARSFGCARLFCYSEFVLDKGRTFYYIKEAEILDSFHELSGDLTLLSFASVMLELARNLALDGEDNTPLVDLLLRGLMRIREHREQVKLICHTFIMRVLSDNGFMPELDGCGTCGRPFSEGQRWSFSVHQGCLLCEAHTLHQERFLRSGTLSALNYIVSAPPQKLYAFTVSEAIEAELEPLIIRYLKDHTGMYLKSLEFVQSLGF